MMVRGHEKEEYRLEQKRLDMSKMFEAEIQNYLRVIKARDNRIEKLKETIRKALKMMKYPRLMELIVREHEFDKFEYTWEQKIDLAKKEAHLIEKEEKEIRDKGVILCPRTTKELYDHVRATEKEFKEAVHEQDL